MKTTTYMTCSFRSFLFARPLNKEVYSFCLFVRSFLLKHNLRIRLWKCCWCILSAVLCAPIDCISDESCAWRETNPVRKSRLECGTSGEPCGVRTLMTMSAAAMFHQRSPLAGSIVRTSAWQKHALPSTQQHNSSRHTVLVLHSDSLYIQTVYHQTRWHFYFDVFGLDKQKPPRDLLAHTKDGKFCLPWLHGLFFLLCLTAALSLTAFRIYPRSV